MDVCVPTTTAPKLVPRRHFGTQRPPQATVQDWYRAIIVSASTTLLPMPMLIPSMEAAACQWAADGAADAAKAHAAFASGLRELASDIQQDNVGGRADKIFSKFDPTTLECSISL